MLADPKHPIWKILRLTVLCITGIVVLHLNYKNGLVPKDFGTIVSLLTSVGLFDYFKSKLTSKVNSEQ